jgi:hypothetical protein
MEYFIGFLVIGLVAWVIMSAKMKGQRTDYLEEIASNLDLTEVSRKYEQSLEIVIAQMSDPINSQISKKDAEEHLERCVSYLNRLHEIDGGTGGSEFRLKVRFDLLNKVKAEAARRHNLSASGFAGRDPLDESAASKPDPLTPAAHERQTTQAPPLGAAIQVAFDDLQQECPGAAYIFARCLNNAREILDNSDISRPEKIEVIERQISDAAPVTHTDAGLSILGMKFVLLILDAEQDDIEGSLMYSVAFRGIAQFGECYREICDEDRLPPKSDNTKELLKSIGQSCLADVVAEIEDDFKELVAKHEGASAKQGDEDIRPILALHDRRDEDIWSFIALYDLRDEAAFGSLEPRIRQLRNLIEVA